MNQYRGLARKRCGNNNGRDARPCVCTLEYRQNMCGLNVFLGGGDRDGDNAEVCEVSGAVV